MKWPFVTRRRYEADIATIRADIEAARKWSAQLEQRLAEAGIPPPDDRVTTKIAGGIRIRPW